MKEQRYFYVPNASEVNVLPEKEAQHATRVLRLIENDEIFLLDGRGDIFRAEITDITNKRCQYSIIDKTHQDKYWQRDIHIAIAPTKMMERMEWMVEKATEIGVDHVSFVDCAYSERHKIRIDRIDNITIAAMKQSHNAWKTSVDEIIKFKNYINNNSDGECYICHCYNEIEREDLFENLKHIPCDSKIHILIGPEGDFSLEEIKYAISKGYKSVSLGQARLRTETAALSAVMMCHLSR